MTRDEFISQLQAKPLIASVQASEGSPVDNPSTLALLAKASLDNGVGILRLQGVENIKHIRHEFKGPIIGLIKKSYPESDVYITPTAAEVDDLIATGADVIALDGTLRDRPNNESLSDLVDRIHQAGLLVLADIDSAESAHFAIASGADMISTTLSGYTGKNPQGSSPDLELVRELALSVDVPVIGEGRYSTRWEVEAALRAGASGVVVGGALNDPVKQTIGMRPRFTPADALAKHQVGAVDIGGTWIRFGVFTSDWMLVSIDKNPNPPTREERLAWIKDRIAAHDVHRVGVSTGGVVDPRTGEVWKAKEYLMHDHVGIVFSEATLGIPTVAWGDGHATAWAHACLPQFAGRRVATIAIGTGVGCGYIQEGGIFAGPRGEYPRLNDLHTSTGQTFEDLLGGKHLTKTPTEEQKKEALVALEEAVTALREMYFCQDIVIGGGVGLSDWMAPHLLNLGLVPSPMGEDAGLYGAAALALFT